MIKKCIICQKEFKTYPCEVKKGGGKYCSAICMWKDPKYRRKNNGSSGKHWELSEETINKMKNNRNSPETEFKSGEKHPKWVGNNITKRPLHIWITRKKGKPLICEICGATREEKAFHWANKDHSYKRNPDDFIALCPPCHKKYDMENN